MSQPAPKERANSDPSEFVGGGEPPSKDADFLLAVEENQVSLVAEMLATDPDRITQYDPKSGVTAMHIAAGLGNFSMVRLLVEQDGADPLRLDFLNRDSIDMARISGNHRVLGLLVEHAFLPLDEDADENPGVVSEVISFPAKDSE